MVARCCEIDSPSTELCLSIAGKNLSHLSKELMEEAFEIANVEHTRKRQKSVRNKQKPYLPLSQHQLQPPFSLLSLARLDLDGNLFNDRTLQLMPWSAFASLAHLSIRGCLVAFPSTIGELLRDLPRKLEDFGVDGTAFWSQLPSGEKRRGAFLSRVLGSDSETVAALSSLYTFASEPTRSILWSLQKDEGNSLVSRFLDAVVSLLPLNIEGAPVNVVEVVCAFEELLKGVQSAAGVRQIGNSGQTRDIDVGSTKKLSIQRKVIGARYPIVEQSSAGHRRGIAFTASSFPFSSIVSQKKRSVRAIETTANTVDVLQSSQRPSELSAIAVYLLHHFRLALSLLRPSPFPSLIYPATKALNEKSGTTALFKNKQGSSRGRKALQLFLKKHVGTFFPSSSAFIALNSVGLRSLSSLPLLCPRVVLLNLSGNALHTDDLKPLSLLPDLEALDLRDNPRISTTHSPLRSNVYRYGATSSIEVFIAPCHN